MQKKHKQTFKNKFNLYLKFVNLVQF